MEAASRADALAPPAAAAVAPDTRLLPRVVGLVGLGSLVGYLWALDPAKDGVWPPCPSRVLLGIDCPGCGGLRGTHDLLHGDVVGALDHNILLPFLLLMLAVPVALWMLPLVGRAARSFEPPLRVYWVAMGLAAVFTVVRNLPVPALAFLGSG